LYLNINDSKYWELIYVKNYNNSQMVNHKTGYELYKLCYLLEKLLSEFKYEYICDMYNLVWIYSGCLKFEHDTESFSKLLYKCRILPHLNSISLSYYQIMKIPENIGYCTNLQELWLYGNKLTDLPETFSRLEKLKILELGGNKFTKIPDVIGILFNLEKLYLYNNKLSKLNTNICNLSKLRDLSIHNNKLKSLPRFIGNFKNLLYLNVSNNQLTKLPKTIDNLINLKYLDISKNNFTIKPKLSIEEKLIEYKI
jgi:Leucine-rich repeat (LRR) protein